MTFVLRLYYNRILNNWRKKKKKKKKKKRENAREERAIEYTLIPDIQP